MYQWLKHAFSVRSSDPVNISLAQEKVIDAVCIEIVRRRMTLPAQMLIESSAPLNFLTGQTLRFIEPVLGAVLDPAGIRDFASFLEQRGALEYICQRLADLQSADETKA